MRKKPLKGAFFLLGVIFVLAVVSNYAQSSCQKWENKIKSRDLKRLKNEFGLDLSSKHVERVQKCKLRESRVTYLLIKMPENSAKNFLSVTKNAKRPPGVLADFEDEECHLLNPCPRIGMVFSPSDAPDEEIDQWTVENNYRSDAIASLRRIDLKKRRLKDYASFFLDTKRDLLLLWYKFD